MRKEPFGVGSIIHIYNRGNRKQKIVNDDKDRWRFLQMLFYFNHNSSIDNLFRKLQDLLKSDFYRKLVWPSVWPEKNRLVNIIAFCLKDNHFHLILQEINEEGTAKFMQKFGTGMTNYFNTKYKETGRLFQGAYKARLVDTDNYLKYLSVYVQVKNVLESYPSGINGALLNFDDAYKFVLDYKYGSLGAHVLQNNEAKKIIDNTFLKELFTDDEYKSFAKDCLLNVSFDQKKSQFNFM